MPKQGAIYRYVCVCVCVQVFDLLVHVCICLYIFDIFSVFVIYAIAF